MRHSGLAVSLVLLVLLVLLAPLGCDRSQPLEPAIQAAGAAGPKVTAPSNTNALAASQSSIDVSWQDNSSNETGFEMHRSAASGAFALLASTGAGVTSYSDTGLAPSTQYCYKVRAFKRADGKTSYSDFSNTSCATTLAPPVPAAPGGVDAKPVNSTSVEVRWIDHSTDEDGFRVERAANPSSIWTTVATVNANATSLLDGGLVSEQQVCYRVIAFNAGGTSPPSNVDCTAMPAAPSGLVATATGSDVNLAWTDHSGVEDGFQVRRWTASAGTPVVVARLPANATTYRDLGLADDTYWYQVLATKDGGTSGTSNNASAVVATAPPLSPSSADATPAGSSVAVITWGDVTTEAGFRVERSTDGGASWIAAGTVGMDETSFYDVDQASEQPLCYRVIAFNSQGDSPPSNTDCTTLPAAPYTPSATLVEGPAFDVTWTDNSAIEDGYEVQRLFCDWDMCHDWESIAILGPNATSYRDADLWQYAYGYYYRVVALKDGGRSDPSGEVFVMMPPP